MYIISLPEEVFAWSDPQLIWISLEIYSTFFGRKSLTDVIVADAVPLFPKVILYSIVSPTFTVFSLLQSEKDFLIRSFGAGISSSSQSSSSGFSSGLTHATFLYSLLGISVAYVVNWISRYCQSVKVQVTFHSIFFQFTVGLATDNHGLFFTKYQLYANTSGNLSVTVKFVTFHPLAVTFIFHVTISHIFLISFDHTSVFSILILPSVGSGSSSQSSSSGFSSGATHATFLYFFSGIFVAFVFNSISRYSPSFNVHFTSHFTVDVVTVGVFTVNHGLCVTV